MSTKTETPPASKPETKCNVNKAKKGDVWSRHSFGRVVEASGLYPTLRIENNHPPMHFGAHIAGLPGE